MKGKEIDDGRVFPLSFSSPFIFLSHDLLLKNSHGQDTKIKKGNLKETICTHKTLFVDWVFEHDQFRIGESSWQCFQASTGIRSNSAVPVELDWDNSSSPGFWRIV